MYWGFSINTTINVLPIGDTKTITNIDSTLTKTHYNKRWNKGGKDSYYYRILLNHSVVCLSITN